MRINPSKLIQKFLILLVLFSSNISLKLLAQQSVRFAVIGDYGFAGQAELDVANLVKSWNPDFIITTGDNNYEDGADSTIDRNIGQYYHEFIYPYIGSYGAGDTVNRFFPTLGNHDWRTPGAIPYLNYFTLPGNERYYDFIRGNVHFFVVDSDSNEIDGITSTSIQANWLHDRLSNSTSIWKIVYLHRAPYSSGSRHGSKIYLQWPFKQWGASAVLAGHDHIYERIVHDDLPYFVNGLGGRSIYTFGTPIDGSLVRYNDDYGAMLITAFKDSMVFQFITRIGMLIDSYTILPSVSISMNVSNGWNIISLPLVVQDLSKELLFPTSTSQAFTYHSLRYELRDTIADGQGYWLKFNSEGITKLTGLPVFRDTVEVVSGWNLIGSISIPLPVEGIIQIPDNNVTSSYYAYNGDYVVIDTLFPGKGYWVKANKFGKLILSSQ